MPCLQQRKTPVRLMSSTRHQTAEVGGQHRDVPGEEDAGVVDENVHAAVARLDRRVELRDALLVRDVDGEGLRLAARVDELRRHRPRCFLGHVGAGDSSALGGQTSRGRTADPAAGTGDHTNLPV